MPKHAPHHHAGVAPIQAAAPPPVASGNSTIRRKSVNPVNAQPAQERAMPGSESVKERRDKQITELVFSLRNKNE